jgi:folate-binding protein YgfZ
MEAQSSEPVLETPLVEEHRAAGATMGTWFGCDLPNSWSSPREEQRYAVESVALVDKNHRAYFAFNGPDRARYLNAILTNNIKDLTVHQGLTSLLLNAQGRILAELDTFAEAERLFCVSYRMIRARLAEVLEKYIIMDDVTLTDESDKFGTLALEGPKAAQVTHELTGIDLQPMQELGWSDGSLHSGASSSTIPCRVVKSSPAGVAGAEFLVSRADLSRVWEILLSAAQKHGGGPMGYEALSAQRLVQSVPWFGYDFGDKQIPHEAGLEASHISYTKGCYTGQEIVERVRSRGQVNRKRVELLFSGQGVPRNGAELLVKDKPVGFVTRAAQSWYPPVILGMGYLGKENRELGSVLQWSGGSATVVKFEVALKPATHRS